MREQVGIKLGEKNSPKFPRLVDNLKTSDDEV